jgi:hypothetical protein
MAEINLIYKKSLILSGHCIIIKYRPTAHTQFVDVHVARTAKGKKVYFYFRINSLINSQVFRTTKLKWRNRQTTDNK